MSFHLHKPSGLWFVKYYENGREKREYTGRGTEGQEAAQERDLEIKRARRQGRPAVPDDMTFIEVTDAYLRKPLSEKTRESRIQED